ncbi:MAG: hypothetical protein ABIK28_15295 [Planctomycetota bacterium]
MRDLTGYFLARVLMHVPMKNARRVTLYGLYSNRVRGEWKKRRQSAKEKDKGGGATVQPPDEPWTEADEFTKKRKAAWAKRIQKIWEVNPLACPRCGGEMKVISVLIDPRVIDRILKHLRKKGRAPPGDEAAA